MKKKKEIIGFGNPEKNIALFNAALGNAPMTETYEESPFDNYTEEEFQEACEALRDDFVSDSEMLKTFFRNDTYGKGRLSRIIIQNTEIDPNNFTEEEAKEIIDDILYDIAEIVDKDFLVNYLEENYKSLTEEDEFDDDFEDEIDFEDEEDAESEKEVTDDEEETDINHINQLIPKKIQFPVIISCISDGGEAIKADEEDKKEIAENYADVVISNFDENKKFILAALELYDFEIYYKELDPNSNIKFEMEIDQEVSNDELIRVIKRYFNAEVDELSTVYGSLSIQPVLDNKFVVMV